MSATWLRLLLCLSLALAVAGPAHAQTSTQTADEAARSAAARTLFEQGLAEADGEHWREAAALFESALVQRDSPVIRFNLGAALMELNRLVEASALLRTLETDERANAELRTDARKRRESLERRLAFLTILVDTRAPRTQVLMDEKLVAPALLGTALPVDPRLHRLVLRSEDNVLDEEQVGLGEGEARTVHLQAVAPPVVVATPAPLRVRSFPSSAHAESDAAPSDDQHARRKRRRVWGIGAAAVAVAAGVVAGVLLAGRTSDGSPSAFSPGSVNIRVPQ